jgi:hypothetical protein
VVVGEQHHEVRHQVGQRVDAVGDQALRLGQHADHDLAGGQHQVDAHADPGAARCGRRALRGGVLGVFGVVEVEARLGQPAMTWKNADGSQQLAFATGPGGTQTFMVFHRHPTAS